ncbi:protein Mis18-beta [Thunnus maccoyii]|uniref:protein Mis18-beta n=1 Tax=Thunnus maccoyii TaxID=8240 RepID=UPI001C4C80CA|nr:protein Mis18-beta [Thunnus maccoyii]
MEFNDSLLSQRSTDIKLATEVEHRQWLTLHCEQCKTVLGDSLGVCGEVRCMDSIMCIRVTDDVVLSDEMESGHKGEMANCIYSSLKCRGCRCAVGKVIHSAPSRLAMIRSIYLLHKANISCYILDSYTMVKASTLTFDLKPLRENIYEMRRQFEAQFDQMTLIKSRLADRSVASESDK